MVDIDKGTDEKIIRQVKGFRNDIRQVFFNKLSIENGDNLTIAQEQADYLLVSMIGLLSASKICINNQLENYIEDTFKRL